MLVFVPFTKIQPGTQIALIGTEYTPVRIEGDFGYSSYFKDRWNEAETFINIEHDVIVYPGAISALLSCPEHWCAYDYSSTSNWAAEGSMGILHSVHLGCMKISKEFIEKTKGIWDKPVDWHLCDVHLFDEATKAGIKPHQHFPGVVNANPVRI